MKNAKIIATIGPASESPEMIEKLALAGMDVCRLNFSFGTHEEHKRKIETIREVSRKIGKPLAILLDLQGPKIRVGKLKSDVMVKKDDIVFLSGKTEHKEELVIPTTYSKIASDTQEGKTILMADGKIILRVMSTEPRKKLVRCRVINGGPILTGKGINLPYTNVSLPALTPKDREDAVFGAKNGVDYMGLSFVRTAKDVLQLRRLLKQEKNDVPIIAKLEKPEALDNLDEIIDVVDGVMVARGDLAVELSFAKVPVAQKRILHHANRKAKLTIIATEMLSSMVDNPLPTRAEASDVANAIFDGSDTVMLSNESATGKYPVKAVEAMRAIVEESETAHEEMIHYRELDLPEHHELKEAMCECAAHLSYSLEEKALVVLTTTGESARILSKYRPQSLIYGVTFDPRVYHKMAFYHGVLPILLPSEMEHKEEKDLHRTYDMIKKELKKRKLVNRGDRLILLIGVIGKNGKWGVNAVNVTNI